MSTTRDKVDKLEAELRRSDFSGPSSLRTLTMKHKIYIGVWIILNFFVLGFLLLFQPGFVTYEDENGDIQLSIKKTIIWWAVLDIILAVVMYAYKYHSDSKVLQL